jgi:flagellar hook-length control protein FliK
LEPALLEELPSPTTDALDVLPDETALSDDLITSGTTEPDTDVAPDAVPTQRPDTGEAGAPAVADVQATDVRPAPAVQPPVAQVLPNVSRAAIDGVQGERVAPVAELGDAAPLGADPLAETTPAAGAETGDSTDTLTREGSAEGEQPDRDATATRTREQPQSAPDRSSTSSDRVFDVTRSGARPVERAPAADAATQPRAVTERGLPPERAADVLRQVRVHLTPGMRQATVRLEPATLGRVAIRIALRDGRATTEVRAERASTLEALERHVPELRAALAQQGIDAGEFDLGLGFDDGPSFADEHPSGDSRSHTARVASRLGEASASRTDTPSPSNPSNVDASGVDTYA